MTTCLGLTVGTCGCTGCSVGKARCFWRCDSPGTFWTPSSWHSLDLHGLAKGAEVVKSQLVSGWLLVTSICCSHPSRRTGTAPLHSPVQRRTGGKGNTGSKTSQQSSLWSIQSVGIFLSTWVHKYYISCSEEERDVRAVGILGQGAGTWPLHTSQHSLAQAQNEPGQH